MAKQIVTTQDVLNETEPSAVMFRYHKPAKEGDPKVLVAYTEVETTGGQTQETVEFSGPNVKEGNEPLTDGELTTLKALIAKVHAGAFTKPNVVEK